MEHLGFKPPTKPATKRKRKVGSKKYGNGEKLNTPN
jgi:hypothetical protein